MQVACVNEANYSDVIAFLQRDQQAINEWTQLLKQGLFGICALNTDGQIESVFIFDDYPYSLQALHASITRSSWHKWLKTHFEGTNETFHTLWLTKWYIAAGSAFDANTLKMVLSSIFISNFEIKSILLALPSTSTDAAEQQTFHGACKSLFSRLHRIQRSHKNKECDENKNEDGDNSLSGEIDLHYCVAAKILPSIEIRRAMVEDFDELMPMFNRQSLDFQEKYGEFFVAELIEKSQHDKRLTTLVAICSNKPVAFVCFTTNIDGPSLRSSFFLDNFDDLFDVATTAGHTQTDAVADAAEPTMDALLDKCTNDPALARKIVEFVRAYYEEYQSAEKELTSNQAQSQADDDDDDSGNFLVVLKTATEYLDENSRAELAQFVHRQLTASATSQSVSKPKLTVDTSMEAEDTAAEEQKSNAVLISLFCVHPNYVYCTKSIAQTIFNFYPAAHYLLAATVHDKPTSNWLDYFHRVYARPCNDYPYDLYLTDRYALNASLSLREIDWKLDTDAVNKMVHSAVPNREQYLSGNASVKSVAVVVDFKVIGLVYVEPIPQTSLSDYVTAFDAECCRNATNAARLIFMVLNPLFANYAKAIFKEVMRQTGTDVLFYEYRADRPQPDSSVIENFVQLTPKKYVYCASSSKAAAPKHDSFALYTFDRKFYAEAHEQINHKIVIVAGFDDCAYGCIQYLITQKELRFNNITLIVTGDDSKLTRNLSGIEQQSLMFKSNIVPDATSNGDYVQKLFIENKVHIVYDDICELNVNKKTLCLSDEGVCSYDVLVFANGLGPVHIMPQSAAGSEYENVLLVSPELPAQVQQLDKYMQRNKNVIANQDDKIVLYGDYINMLCISNRLISSYGVRGDQIIIIKCLSSTSQCAFFQNEALSSIIDQQLRELKVQVLENAVPFEYITSSNDQNKVSGIKLQHSENIVNAMVIAADADIDETQPSNADQCGVKLKSVQDDDTSYYTLDTALLILCQNEISWDTLNVTNQDSFVVDGQIVTDDQFRTQNDAIYAIGSLAKISRKSVASKYSGLNEQLPWFQYTNAFDIGLQSASMIVENILNTQQPDASRTRIDLEDGTCVFAKLLNGNYFFYAYHPQTVMDKHAASHIKCLQSVKRDQLSYIGFDASGNVRQILYYGREWKSEWMKCAQLINVHSSFLGDSLPQSFQDSDNEFVNVCKVLNKTQYQIMCDDRFRRWLREISTSGDVQSDKEQLNKDAKSLIQEILSSK